MRPPRLGTVVAIVLTLCLAGIAVTFGAAWLLIHHREPPYHMWIISTDAGSSVRFTRPGKGFVSPDFRIAPQGRPPVEIVLDSGAVSIPGGVIESSDTSLLPGIFEIRIGGSLFEVMERGLVVDNKTIDWQLSAEP